MRKAFITLNSVTTDGELIPVTLSTDLIASVVSFRPKAWAGQFSADITPKIKGQVVLECNAPMLLTEETADTIKALLRAAGHKVIEHPAEN